MPNQIIVPDSNGLVMYYYSAEGALLRQEEVRDSVVYKVRDYVGAIEYVNGAIDQIRHENGYITLDKGLSQDHLLLSGTETVNDTYQSISTLSDRTIPSPINTEYLSEEVIILSKGFEVSLGAEFLADIDTFPVLGLDYKWFVNDHLGNIRVEFEDDGNGNAVALAEHNYYGFGGEWESNTDNSDGRYRHLRLGGERQTSFGLDYDMHAFRDYSPWVGRWNGPDMLSDWAPSLSPYRYAFNNPVNYVDPLGLFESRSEARKYAKDNNIRTGLFGSSSIRQQSDGSYAIENSKAHTSIANDSEFGVQTGLLVESTKTYFTPTISAYEPNLAERISDGSILGKFSINIIDAAWMTAQDLNPLDTRIQRLSGEIVTNPIERQMALVSTVNNFGPLLRSSKAVSSLVPSSMFLPRLNAPQFSQLFKGSFVPRLTPVLRGKLNRLLNYGRTQLKQNAESGTLFVEPMSVYDATQK